MRLFLHLIATLALCIATLAAISPTADAQTQLVNRHAAAYPADNGINRWLRRIDLPQPNEQVHVIFGDCFLAGRDPAYRGRSCADQRSMTIWLARGNRSELVFAHEIAHLVDHRMYERHRQQFARLIGESTSSWTNTAVAHDEFASTSVQEYFADYYAACSVYGPDGLYGFEVDGKLYVPGYAKRGVSVRTYRRVCQWMTMIKLQPTTDVQPIPA